MTLAAAIFIRLLILWAAREAPGTRRERQRVGDPIGVRRERGSRRTGLSGEISARVRQREITALAISPS